MCRFYYDVILGLVFWSFDEPVSFNYSKDKEKWVTFNNGKDKMKLRKFIHKKSSNLSMVSMGNTIPLKRIFIEAYDLGGIEAVEKVYNHSLNKILDSIKK